MGPPLGISHRYVSNERPRSDHIAKGRADLLECVLNDLKHCPRLQVAVAWMVNSLGAESGRASNRYVVT